MSDIKRLADAHEVFVADLLGARQSRASGSQWHDQADGRQSRYAVDFAFAFDCKAAMPGTKSISVTRAMWDKLEQQSHGERSLLPLRFYTTLRGEVWRDLVVMNLHDLAELLEAARTPNPLITPKGLTRVDL